jgi:hypothetical protein
MDMRTSAVSGFWVTTADEVKSTIQLGAYQVVPQIAESVGIAFVTETSKNEEGVC